MASNGMSKAMRHNATRQYKQEVAIWLANLPIQQLTKDHDEKQNNDPHDEQRNEPCDQPINKHNALPSSSSSSRLSIVTSIASHFLTHKLTNMQLAAKRPRQSTRIHVACPQ
jgi:hypothetical protein